MKPSAILFWISLFGALIILNGYSLYQKNSLTMDIETARMNLEASRENLMLMKDRVMTRESLQFGDEGKTVDGDLVLTTGIENEVRHTLQSLLADGYTYIFNFSEINCTVCVEQELEFVKELAEKVGEERVLILARYADPRDLLLFKRLNRLEMEVYNKGDGNLGLSIEEANEPFMFLTDSDFVVRYLFVPDPELPELSRSYYELVSKKIQTHP